MFQVGGGAQKLNSRGRGTLEEGFLPLPGNEFSIPPMRGKFPASYGMYHRDRGLVIIYDQGGSGVKRLFTENIFAAHSAREEENSRPTGHRVKIFPCLLL